VEIQDHYANLGFTVLAIETTNRPALAREFTTSVHANFPIGVDDASVSSTLFGVNATPTSILIDREGRIFFTNVGYGPGGERALAAQVEYLLRRS
jgi:hypothetical protein